MTINLIVGSDDLRKDARIYADVAGYTLVRTLANIGNGDTVIFYTHGVYRINAHGQPEARNEIEWMNIVVTAANAAPLLMQILPDRNNLTLIVHACYSAGTVESRPTAANRLTTFAGVLCRDLGAAVTVAGVRRFQGVSVTGYVGATKIGYAGFNALNPVNTKRKRGRPDPNNGETFKVDYAFDQVNNLVFIRNQGTSVRWT